MISLPVIENHRHDAIVPCILFDVEHDQRYHLVVSAGGSTSLHLNGNDLKHNQDVFIPLALALDRSVNIFSRARIDVLRAKILVRQLLACKITAASSANDVPPLVDVDAGQCLTTPLPVTMQLTS